MIALVFLALACTPPQPGEIFSDSEAKTAIEKFLRANQINLPVGRWDVVRERVDFGKRRISWEHYKFCRAFVKSGILRFTREREIAGTYATLEKIDRYLQGVEKEVEIEITPLGMKLMPIPHPTDKDSLIFSPGIYSVGEILQNEAVNKPPDRYRVVVGTHQVEVQPEIAEALRELGLPNSAERKFKVLLKFDAVKNTWQVVAIDEQDKDEEFRTDNVASYLKAR